MFIVLVCSWEGVLDTFSVGSVARLELLQSSYDLAIDVGCLHSLANAKAHGYAAGLARLLRPGASYLLFGRLTATPIRDGLHGLSEQRVRELFATGWQIERVAPGLTINAQGSAFPSAWFWLTRT